MYRYRLIAKESNKYELSRGEICVANFIPPANGASQGNYFQAKIKFATSLLASLAGGQQTFTSLFLSHRHDRNTRHDGEKSLVFGPGSE